MLIVQVAGAGPHRIHPWREVYWCWAPYWRCKYQFRFSVLWEKLNRVTLKTTMANQKWVSDLNDYKTTVLSASLQGWFNGTELYYGYYLNGTLEAVSGLKYDMKFAYFFVCAAYYILTLIILLARYERIFTTFVCFNDNEILWDKRFLHTGETSRQIVCSGHCMFLSYFQPDILLQRKLHRRKWCPEFLLRHQSVLWLGFQNYES